MSKCDSCWNLFVILAESVIKKEISGDLEKALRIAYTQGWNDCETIINLEKEDEKKD